MTKGKPYSISWIVEKEDDGKEIKAFLSEEGISRRALTDIKFTGGKITVNGVEETVRCRLRERDRLVVVFPPELLSGSMVGEGIPLEIIYEDSDIIIINKPPYMSTIPSREHPSGTLANALVYYYEKKEVRAAVHIVTRLDRNTSGLVLVAKHRHAHHLLSLMQQEYSIHRTYEALVSGVLLQETKTIDAPIGRKSDSIIEREVRDDGKKAITHLDLLAQFGDYAHIRLRLETGRTHQIRVHMSHIGHPLLGDDLYGGKIEKIDRQALHCAQLQFFHPLQKREMTFGAQLPNDMNILLEKNGL